MVMDGAGWHKANALRVPDNNGVVLPASLQSATQPRRTHMGVHPGKRFPQRSFQQHRRGGESTDAVPGSPRKESGISGKCDRISVDR